MAEAQLGTRVSPAGVAHVIRGMGILRLLRHWPADQVAAGGRADPWPGRSALRARNLIRRTPVAAPEPVDRRAWALALERTLADWRAAERNLEGMVMDSLDWTRTEMEVEALRAAHHRLFSQLRRSI